MNKQDAPSSSSHLARPDRLFRIISRQNAEKLASFSGMPFGQLGLGTALTPGTLWHAHADYLVRANDASHGVVDPETTGFIEGAVVKIKDVSTAAPSARSSSPPEFTRLKVTNNRATVALPGLAQNPAFVKSLRAEIRLLLQEFSSRWIQLTSDAASRRDDSPAMETGKEKSVALSIVRSFEDVWVEKGWHLVFLAAGEDKETRREMWDTITSSMLREFQTALDQHAARRC